MTRKVSSEAAAALLEMRDYGNGNTTVSVTKCSDGLEYATMFLHGNRIATYNKAADILELSYAGWQTLTTRDRLNAITEAYNDERPFHSKDNFPCRSWFVWER